MDTSRAAEAEWALHAPAWPLEWLRTQRLFRLARREGLLTSLHTAALAQAATPALLGLSPGAAFAARSALTQRRLRHVLATGVAVEALTAAAGQDVRYAGAAAQRAAAAASAGAARALLRDEVVAARLHQVELTQAVLLRGLGWGLVCLVLGWLGVHYEQRVVARPFGASPTFASFRVYLGLACTALSLAILGTAIRSYRSLRDLTCAIDALGCLSLSLPQPSADDAEAGAGRGGSGKGPEGGAAVALNPLAAAAAPAPAGAAVEWAAPRAPPPAAPQASMQQQSFAEAVGALGAGVPPAELGARCAAALSDLRAVRERERMRVVGEGLGLLLIGVGAVGALGFALSSTTAAQFRWFTGAAFALAWLTALIPGLAGARARVEVALALAEGARVAAAGLRLGAFITAPPPCSLQGLLRLLLCPCRLMRSSPSARA